MGIRNHLKAQLTPKIMSTISRAFTWFLIPILAYYIRPVTVYQPKYSDEKFNPFKKTA